MCLRVVRHPRRRLRTVPLLVHLVHGLVPLAWDFHFFFKSSLPRPRGGVLARAIERCRSVVCMRLVTPSTRDTSSSTSTTLGAAWLLAASLRRSPCCVCASRRRVLMLLVLVSDRSFVYLFRRQTSSREQTKRRRLRRQEGLGHCTNSTHYHTSTGSSTKYVCFLVRPHALLLPFTKP